jgi:hypothetical protein
MSIDPEVVGYIASGLVLLTFATTEMRLLRIIAILSNAAFISYGALDGIMPVLVLHTILLPLNVFRLGQIEIATRRWSLSRRCEIAEPSSGLRIGGSGVRPQRLEAIGDGRWMVILTARGMPRPLRLMVEIAPEIAETAAGTPAAEPRIAAMAAPDR